MGEFVYALPQRLTRIVAKIKYQLNIEMNGIQNNNLISLRKIPDIFITLKEKYCHKYKIFHFFINKKNSFL